MPLHVACSLSVCHCLFSHYARQYLLKMGGQLDKCMLHWQPAECCIFQLFVIICYLTNKVLLLLHCISYWLDQLCAAQPPNICQPTSLPVSFSASTIHYDGADIAITLSRSMCMCGYVYVGMHVSTKKRTPPIRMT